MPIRIHTHNNIRITSETFKITINNTTEAIVSTIHNRTTTSPRTTIHRQTPIIHTNKATIQDIKLITSNSIRTATQITVMIHIMVVVAKDTVGIQVKVATVATIRYNYLVYYSEPSYLFSVFLLFYEYIYDKDYIIPRIS